MEYYYIEGMKYWGWECSLNICLACPKSLVTSLATHTENEALTYIIIWMNPENIARHQGNMLYGFLYMKCPD